MEEEKLQNTACDTQRGHDFQILSRKVILRDSEHRQLKASAVLFCRVCGKIKKVPLQEYVYVKVEE